MSLSMKIPPTSRSFPVRFRSKKFKKVLPSRGLSEILPSLTLISIPIQRFRCSAEMRAGKSPIKLRFLRQLIENSIVRLLEYDSLRCRRCTRARTRELIKGRHPTKRYVLWRGDGAEGEASPWCTGVATSPAKSEAIAPKDRTQETSDPASPPSRFGRILARNIIIALHSTEFASTRSRRSRSCRLLSRDSSGANSPGAAAATSRERSRNYTFATPPAPGGGTVTYSLTYEKRAKS